MRAALLGEFIHSILSRQWFLRTSSGAGLSPSAGAMIELGCKQERGAALFTRTRGIREEASCRSVFQKHIRNNFVVWYKYATETLGHTLRLEDMVGKFGNGEHF